MKSGGSIVAIYNNQARSNFFLKIMFSSSQVISSPVRSATVHCILTDLEDDKFVVAAALPGQSSNLAL